MTDFFARVLHAVLGSLLELCTHKHTHTGVCMCHRHSPLNLTRPTGPFTILELQDQGIGQFYVVQKRHATDFEAPKCWKDQPGVVVLTRFTWEHVHTYYDTRDNASKVAMNKLFGNNLWFCFCDCPRRIHPSPFGAYLYRCRCFCWVTLLNLALGPNSN